MSTDNPVGITIGEVKGLLADLMEKLSSETAHEWVAALKLFLKKQNPWQVVKNVLIDMIALGHYGWVDSNITKKNFGPETLVTGEGAKLYHFDHEISSEDTVVEMDKQGFKPATLGDLLDFGVKNSEEQRKYPIIALGSIADVDGRSVAYIRGSGSERRLCLDRFDNHWLEHCRFLAVRK
jgi:hypothetical protein